MNGTLLHVTRQDISCFVLCVLIKISCSIHSEGRYFSHVGRAVIRPVELFRRVVPERLVTVIILTQWQRLGFNIPLSTFPASHLTGATTRSIQPVTW